MTQLAVFGRKRAAAIVHDARIRIRRAALCREIQCPAQNFVHNSNQNLTQSDVSMDTTQGVARSWMLKDWRTIWLQSKDQEVIHVIFHEVVASRQFISRLGRF